MNPNNPMKKLIVEILLTLGCCASANAGWISQCCDAGNWKGRLDLDPVAQPIVLREAHDGQWLAGIQHPGLFGLYHRGNRIFHAGVFQAWNSEGGNASAGPIAGLDFRGVLADVGYDIPTLIDSVGNWVGLPALFRPAHLIADMTTLDVFVGYRPIHSADVNGSWVYGGAAGLKIKFGTSDLQNGNLNAAG